MSLCLLILLLQISADEESATPSEPAPEPEAKAPSAVIRNPDTRVLVQQGYFDLATPYRATEYFIDQMPLPEPLRANVEIKYYQAGHMMYVHPPSLADFKRDLAAFLAP